MTAEDIEAKLQVATDFKLKLQKFLWSHSDMAEADAKVALLQEVSGYVDDTKELSILHF